LKSVVQKEQQDEWRCENSSWSKNETIKPTVL